MADKALILRDGLTVAVTPGKIGAAETTLYTGAVQTLTDTLTDVTGSSQTIVPTSTSSTLLYSFSFVIAYVSSAVPIASFHLWRDGSEITTAKTPVTGATNGDLRLTFQFAVANTSTASTTFKLQARRYSSGFSGKLHQSYYMDGAISSVASSATVSVIEIID